MSRNKSKKNPLTGRLTARYFLTLLGVWVLFFLVILGAQQFVSSFIWQPGDPMYQLLLLIRNNLFWLIFACLIVLWAVVTYWFFGRSLRYLNDVTQAAKELAAPTEEAILLPDELQNLQDEMNLAREQALRHLYMAKEAEQRKNDLIVYLAHDLKTPLTSVIGYLSLLHDEADLSPQTRARYTDIALRKALRLEDLINEFFDITRFNLSDLALEMSTFSLSRMLEQITDEFTPILQEKGLTWERQIAPAVTITGDGNKLDRVFDNLIRNAIAYSYPDAPLTLSLRQEGNQAVICLKNHGRTIPKEKLIHIFEQFYRVDAARSTETGGAGLGLAIAKAILDRHGGTIRAESENESITFSVTLPAAPVVPGQDVRKS